MFQMKLAITLLTAILFLSFNAPDENMTVNTISDPECKLFCPDPPAFSEMFRTVSYAAASGSGTDEIKQDWYSKAMKQIEKDEYNISYNDELGFYQSPNRANNIHFIYHKDVFTAKTRTNKVPLFDVNDKTLNEEEKKYEEVEEWSVKLKIAAESSIGKNGKLNLEGGEIKAAGNKAWIENDKIRIDYTNTKEEMRQDFIIKQMPSSEGKLRLNLLAETKIKMIVGADALMFKNSKGEEKMKYSVLKVWDATGWELRAYFEKNNCELGIKNYELNSERSETFRSYKFESPDSFSIVVNDEDAVYPVTIDPLSTSPGWTAESDQANAQFGYSVSTAGDVNRDGTIDATDDSTIDNDADNFTGGYIVTDLTDDNFVDGTDFAIADSNEANFVSVVRP